MTAAEIAPNTRLGRYRVVKRIGAGAKGIVYLADDEVLGVPVAAKVLNEPLERARREAEVTAQLDHPNIVAIKDVVEHDGRVVLIQQWVSGPTLAELLSDGPLDLTTTLTMGTDICSALGHAHGLGVLHRDLKPSNVLRGATGFMLTDFGAFGQLVSESGLTRAGEIAGTPLWMSPEQVTGAAQSVTSDVYGVGLLLYACLHGEPPGAASTTYLDLMTSRVATDIQVPPSPLRALIAGCLARDQHARPQTAHEVRAALREVAAGGIPSVTVQSPAPGLATVDRRVPLLRAAALVALLAVAIALVLAAGPLAAVAALTLFLGASTAAVWLRRRWSAEEAEGLHRASEVVLGRASRSELTRSMLLDLQVVIDRLKTIDAAFLGRTVVALVIEYEEATEPSTRVAALQQLLLLEERISRQLVPWHVRHKDALTLVIAGVGALASVAAVVAGLMTSDR